MYYIIMLIIAVNIFFASCSSTKQVVKKEIPPQCIPDVQVSIKNNTANFIFKMSANQTTSKEKFDFIRAVSKVHIEIYSGNGGRRDTVEFKNLALSGVDNIKQNASTTLYGTATWNIPERTVLNNIKADFLLYTNDTLYIYTTELNKIFIKNNGNIPALELQSYVENLTDSSAVFSCVARRMKAVENEYIPSSETIRAVIYSNKGVPVWKSGEGMQYLQMLYPVLPKEVGGIYKYSLNWNGKDSNGELLAPGYYKVIMTIPAKPNSYSTTVYLNWKQRYDK